MSASLDARALSPVTELWNCSGYPCPPFKLIILDEADSVRSNFDNFTDSFASALCAANCR